MATPTVGRDGGVDEAALRSYTRTLVDGGVHGLFPCGSIGEFSSLSAAGRRRVVRVVVDEAGSEPVPVLAGCGDTSVDAVHDHVENAVAAGADAAVVVTPYYLSTTQSGLRDFYTSVADAAAIPVVLYNIPALTGQRLAVETVASLATHDTVVGLKDTSGDLRYLRDVVAETPPEFAVLQGATELAVPSLDLGGDGMVAGPANVFPEVLASVYESYRAGDRDRAVRLMNECVNPLLSATDDLPTAAAVKYLYSLREHDIGEPLLPLPTLTGKQRRTLEQRYREVSEATRAWSEA